MAVPSSSQYDVFLSHSSVNKPAVEELALWLVREGLTPFLDKWHLVPGEDWTDALPQALGDSTTCAVIIGPGA
ncbi:MAG: toll/interleukin-1 receptor domain-containing protein, partial [Terriglobales bacterium]